EVEVAAVRPTRHSVTAGAGDVERLTGGKANAERLIEESFRFLLERESNTSILRSFQLTDISRYFPEYEREIRGRLRSLAGGGTRAPRPAPSMRWSTSTGPPSATRTSRWRKPKRNSNLSRTLSGVGRLPARGDARLLCTAGFATKSKPKHA